VDDNLLLIAASGLARETAAVVARGSECELVGYLDDAPGLAGTTISSKPVLGGIGAIRQHPKARLLVCAGKGQTRRAIVARLRELGVTDDRFATLVAPDVHVPASCSIGPGSIVLSGTVMTADVSVGAHVVAMPGVVLTHDDVVGDYATLCAGVTLGGSVTVGEAAYLGMGALVRERLTVGAESILGMGSVLLHDLPRGEIWAGLPAGSIHPTTQLEVGNR
jgi:sugar O-acyltransferase (sialic acid O-acetyltransferase NeuD family)